MWSGLLVAGAMVAACSDDGNAPAAGDDTGGPDTADTTATDAGSDADTTSADAPSTVSVRDWCLRSNAIWCDWMYACLDPDELDTAERSLSVDRDNCASRLTADCQARTMQSVLAERQSFDDEAASNCLDALEVEPCGSWAELIAGEALNPDSCHGITTGLVEPDGECTNALDCAAADAWCWTDPGEDVGACTDSLGAQAFQSACTEAGADACPGRVCATLPENELGWDGICSAHCRVDRNCGPGAGCFALGEDRICLAHCVVDDDCSAGLTCQEVGDASACFVPPA